MIHLPLLPKTDDAHSISPYRTCWMQCQQKRTILSWVDEPVDDTDVTQDDAHHVFHAVSCHTHICFLPDGSRSDESDWEESSGNVERHVDFHGRDSHNSSGVICLCSFALMSALKYVLASSMSNTGSPRPLCV